MAETKVVTEVAGRVCALAANVGDQIGEGDDIILVEAMKMELPVSAPSGGTVKTILVKIDDVVGEGQIIATIEA
ncbi:MAG: acetyl-CoA carboxylase biotin carboxyl carrier protein subunit [Xanthobacteraceae bacterium]